MSVMVEMPIRIVLVLVVVVQRLIIAAHVMQTVQMIVFKIVQAHGVEQM